MEGRRMTVTFCGHRDFYGDEDVKRWLRETVEVLILQKGDGAPYLQSVEKLQD